MAFSSRAVARCGVVAKLLLGTPRKQITPIHLDIQKPNSMVDHVIMVEGLFGL
jgi:hypothetical protein